MLLVVLPAIGLVWWKLERDAQRAVEKVENQARQSLNDGLSELGSSVANIQASIAEDRRRIAQDGRRLDREACERLVFLVWAQWDNKASAYKRELSRNWVQASQAYPAVSESVLFQRYSEWETKFEDLRWTLEQECKTLQNDCRYLIESAESNPGRDAFAEMQAGLRARLEAWQREAAAKLEAVVKEAREDVWGYAANLAIGSQDQEDEKSQARLLAAEISSRRRIGHEWAVVFNSRQLNPQVPGKGELLGRAVVPALRHIGISLL